MTSEEKNSRNKTVDRMVAIRKSRFEKANKPRSMWKHLDEILRHPATLLVIGFALTAGIGGYIQDRQSKIEKDHTELTNAYIAIGRIRQALTEFDLRGRYFAHLEDGWHDTSDAAKEARKAMIQAVSSIEENSHAVLAAFPDDSGKISDVLQDEFSKQQLFISNIDLEADRTEDKEIAARRKTADPSGVVGQSLDKIIDVDLNTVNSCSNNFLSAVERVLYEAKSRHDRLPLLRDLELRLTSMSGKQWTNRSTLIGICTNQE
jgi:hypothetical protein